MYTTREAWKLLEAAFREAHDTQQKVANVSGRTIVGICHALSVLRDSFQINQNTHTEMYKSLPITNNYIWPISAEGNLMRANYCAKQAREVPIPDDHYTLFRDGLSWCCVGPDFQDLQISPAGFGTSPDVAVRNFMQERDRCNAKTTPQPVMPV